MWLNNEENVCVWWGEGMEGTVPSPYLNCWSPSLPHYASLYLRPTLPEGQATAFLAKNFSAVHSVFFHPDVPAFITGECVFKNKSSQLPTTPTTIDIFPQPHSLSSSLSLKP